VLRFKIKKGGLEAISISSLSHRIHAKRASPGFPLRGSLEDWTGRSDRRRTLPAVEGLEGLLEENTNGRQGDGDRAGVRNTGRMIEQ